MSEKAALAPALVPSVPFRAPPELQDHSSPAGAPQTPAGGSSKPRYDISVLNTAAFEYVRTGYNVIRLRRDKKPDGRSWEACSPSTDDGALRLFAGPARNSAGDIKMLGLWLEPPVVVLDFDVHDAPGYLRDKKLGLARFRRDVFYAVLGVTPPEALPSVNTGGGGIHDYYRAPGVDIKCQGGFVPHVDIKAGGAKADGTFKKVLVVAPPSGPDPYGGFYEWTSPLRRPDALPDLPQSIGRFLRAPKGDRDALGQLYQRALELISNLSDAAEGERHISLNETVFELSGRCEPLGLDVESLKDLLRKAASDAGLPEDEFDSTFTDAAKAGRDQPIEPYGSCSNRPLTHQLVALGERETDLFRSGTERYAFDMRGCVVIDLNQTERAKEWLSGRWLDAHPDRKFPINQLGDGVGTLKMKAAQGAERPTFRRFGMNEGRLVYDTKTEVALISTDGVATLSYIDAATAGLYFIPPDSPAPVSRGQTSDPVVLLADLFPSIDQDGAILLVALMLASFNPEVRIPLMVLSGQQGSGKSMLAAFIKLTLDPSGKLPDHQLRSLPADDERSLVNLLAGGGVVCFDNVSRLPSGVQDIACIAITGGEYETRRLYTDGDMRRIRFEKRVILTSIVQPVSKEDLLNRALIFRLAPLSHDRRRAEAALAQLLSEKAEEMRGALFGALPRALTPDESVKPRGHRMLEWLAFAARGLRHFGVEPQQLFDACESLVSLAVDDLLSENPLYCHLLSLEPQWRGTASDLFNTMPPALQRNFRSPRAVSMAIARLEPDIAERGLCVTRVREGRNRTRVIEIVKTPGGRSSGVDLVLDY